MCRRNSATSWCPIRGISSSGTGPLSNLAPHLQRLHCTCLPFGAGFGCRFAGLAMGLTFLVFDTVIKNIVCKVELALPGLVWPIQSAFYPPPQNLRPTMSRQMCWRLSQNQDQSCGPHVCNRGNSSHGIQLPQNKQPWVAVSRRIVVMSRNNCDRNDPPPLSLYTLPRHLTFLTAKPNNYRGYLDIRHETAGMWGKGKWRDLQKLLPRADVKLFKILHPKMPANPSWQLLCVRIFLHRVVVRSIS